MSLPPRSLRALPAFVLLAFVLAAAPFLFRSSLSVNLLTQIAIAMIACLSYNLLLGEGGMLSFGHAVYSGLGGYAAIHALNGIANGALPLPVALVPLAGAMGGALAAMLFGLVATRRSGMPFAMITLGLGELVAAVALMSPALFGGEGGISANRGAGPAIEVYWLAAIHAWFSAAALFGLTRTPLGRLLNAVRDNSERVEFIGYDPRWIRYQVFVVSGAFAGLAGGLGALAFEIVTPEALGAVRSGSYLLFTFLGGTTHFFGPLIGAVLMVFASVVFSEITQAWLLYLGLAFIVVVMFVPGGIAGALACFLEARRRVPLFRLAPAAMALVATGAAFLAGTAALVEMGYRLQGDAGPAAAVPVLGLAADPHRLDSWFGAFFVMLTGAGLFELTRRELARSGPTHLEGR